jgi:hypothetical protein
MIRPSAAAAALCAALTLAACGKDRASRSAAPGDSSVSTASTAPVPPPMVSTGATQAAQRRVDSANAGAGRTQSQVDSLSNAANP